MGLIARIGAVLAVVVIGWNASRFVLAAEQRTKDNQETIQEIKKTQEQIVEWMQKEKEEKIRREVIRKLCEEGKINNPEDCPR